MDKTHFITEWLRSESKVTLITRPRRFGKTTMLSTVENFFDPRFAGHPEYFEKLKVWKDADSRTEKDLSQTAGHALSQITDRGYEKDLLAAVISEERIYRLGFAFSGKEVMVISDREDNYQQNVANRKLL